MRRILLVEDEDPAIRNLKRTLESDGYHVYVARSGKEARAFMAQHRADLVLLDLNLPDVDGLRLGSELREWDPHLPIIVVSVIIDGDKKVRAFKVCADDFVSKPYHMDELLQRIRVQLRHADHMHAGSVPPKIISGPLEVDLEQRLVRVHTQPVELARKEFELLELFVLNMGKVVTYDVILTRVWGDEAESERRNIHVYVNKLRKKIEIPAGCHFIHNESKIGYRFQLSE
ncbi:MAG TPA: response regulator transcription factor [Ktedonobacteraceae bacterium]